MPDGGGAYSTAIYNGAVYAGTAVVPDNDNIADISSDIYSSTNGGNWQIVGGGEIPTKGYVTSIVGDNGVIYAGIGSYGGVSESSWYEASGYVYSSTNGGNWQIVGGGEISGIRGFVTSLAVYNGVVYAGTDQGFVYASSTNGGKWQVVGGDEVIFCGSIKSLAIYNGVLYSGTSDLDQSAVYSYSSIKSIKNGYWEIVGGGQSQ